MKKILIMLFLVLGGGWLNAAASSENSEIYPVPQKVMSEYSSFPVNTAGISFVLSFDETPDEVVNWGMEQYLSTVEALQKNDYEFPKLEICIGNQDNPAIKSFFGELQLPKQGYAVKLVSNSGNTVKIALAGADCRGIYYGLMSLRQLLNSADGKVIQSIADIVDYPVWPERFICDYFGNITEEWINFYASRKIAGIAGLSESNWRNPEWWKQVEPTLKAMKRASDMNLMTIMAQLHIYHFGGKMNIAKEEEIDEFIACCRKMIENGVTYLMIAADDSTPRDINGYRLYYPEEAEKFKSAGEAHGYLMKRIYEALNPDYPEVNIAMVGAPYSLSHGIGDPEIDKYVRDWAAVAPPEVVWIWTGPEVLSPKVTKEEHETMERLLDGHNLYLFDNSNCIKPPVPRWETEYYKGMEKDDNGIVFLLGLGCGARPWETVYFLNAGDYLWNPAAYNKEKSYSTALQIIYGDEACEPVNKLRELYVNGLQALEDCDQKTLKTILPELESSYEMAKNATFKDGKTLDWKAFEYTIDQMRLFCSSSVPEIKVRKAPVPLMVDGVITPDEWQFAFEFMLRTNSDDAEPVRCKALYDDRGLYFVFDVYNDAELPPLPQQAHDNPVYLAADNIELFLQADPNGDYGHFCFDYAGNRFEEPNGIGGHMWNPEWELAVKNNEHGWQAEMFLPFDQLKRLSPEAPKPGDVWLANFHRVDNLKGKIFSWNYSDYGFHTPHFFGRLTFE